MFYNEIFTAEYIHVYTDARASASDRARAFGIRDTSILQRVQCTRSNPFPPPCSAFRLFIFLSFCVCFFLPFIFFPIQSKDSRNRCRNITTAGERAEWGGRGTTRQLLSMLRVPITRGFAAGTHHVVRFARTYTE